MVGVAVTDLKSFEINDIRSFWLAKWANRSPPPLLLLPRDIPIAAIMARAFGSEVDYGQVVKTYSVTNLNKEAASRYSPADVVKIEKAAVSGEPDFDMISTSHVEKQNNTLRMHFRRLTRLTNAFSKKFENFAAAVAMNFAYYNFVKTHGAIRMTPAMAAGIEKSHWTVAELVERCGE